MSDLGASTAMLAARLHGVGDVRVDREAVPRVESGQSLVRVEAIGLCGSDLHWFGEGGVGDAVLDRPLVLGHEFAGIVEEGPQRGTRVAVDPARPCGHCPQCREGNRNLCPNVRFAGHGRNDGGLREFVAWPDELLHALPESMTGADGAMLEPLGVALHAMDLGKPRLASSVAVIGCGPIGLCALQLARIAGATTVIAVEPRAHRRDAARRYGADVVLDPADGDLMDAVHAATQGQGADLVIEAAGSVAGFVASVEIARPGATVVLVGIPDEDHITFPASTARRKGLTLKLSRRMKDVYPRAIALVGGGRVDVRGLVSHTFALERVDEAFTSAFRRDGLKVIVAPGAP